METWAKLVSPLILLALVFAGCASKPDNPRTSPTSPPPTSSTSEPTLPPTVDPEVDLFTLTPEMVGCQFFGIAMHLPAEDVQRHLPEGYTAEGLASSVEVSVNVEGHRCQSFIINNETIIENVSLVQTVARVQVNDTLKEGADFHFYAMEIFASNATVANFLSALGFQIVEADIRFTPSSPSFSLRVAVEGQNWYEITGTNGSGSGDDDTYETRYHQLDSNGSSLWMNWSHTYALPSSPGQGVITVTDGVLEDVRPGDTGTIPGITSLSPASARISFGKL